MNWWQVSTWKSQDGFPIKNVGNDCLFLGSPQSVAGIYPNKSKDGFPRTNVGRAIINLGTDPSPLAHDDNRVQVAYCHSRQKQAGMARKIDTGGSIRIRHYDK